MGEIQARGKLWSQTSILTQWGSGGGGESLFVSKDPGQPSVAAESLLLSPGSSLPYTASAWFPRNDPTLEPASEPESFMILSTPLSWKQAPFDKLFKLRSSVIIFLFLPLHPQSPSQSVLLLLSVIMTPTRLMSGSPWLCLLSSLTLLGSRSTFLQPSVLTPSLCLKPSGSPLPHTCRSLVFWPWTNHLTSVTLIFVWVKWGSQSFYDFSAALWRLSSSHIC